MAQFGGQPSRRRQPGIPASCHPGKHLTLPSAPSPLLSVRQIVAMLRARAPLVAAVTAACLVATAAISLLQASKWSATASIYVDYRENDPIAGRNFSALLDDSYLQTQIDMLKSRAIAEKVVDQLHLDESADFREAASKVGEARARDGLITRIIKNTEVANKRGSRVLEVSYTDRNAESARIHAQAVVDAYIALSQGIANQAARSRTEQYTAQLEQLRGQVDAIQEKLSAYQRETGVIDLPNSESLEEQRLRQMQGELPAEYQAQRQQAAAQRQTTQAMIRNGMRPDEIPEIGSLPVINALKDRLNAVNQRLLEVQATLGVNHPTVKSLRQEQQNLSGQLARESRAAVDRQASDTSRVALQEASLQSAIEEQRKKVFDLMQYRDRMASYRQQLAGAQQVYNAAMQKYDSLLMASSITLPGATVLRQAEAPSAPSNPGLLRSMALGVPVGLILGLLLALALELALRRVRCEDDLTHDLGLPVLGTIGAQA